MNDNSYYGCCACIAPAGTGIIPKSAVLLTENGVALNHYLKGKVSTITPEGNSVEFVTDTVYPYDGYVKITVCIDKPEIFSIKFRIPGWSKATVLNINNEKYKVSAGYFDVLREWKDKDIVTFEFDMGLT
jgi:DUF1680 family protein